MTGETNPGAGEKIDTTIVRSIGRVTIRYANRSKMGDLELRLKATVGRAGGAVGVRLQTVTTTIR